jgi:molecular chaperone DnaK
LEDENMARVIGIDLGTTNSCVAVMEGGEPVVIPNAEGNRTTPSVVAFSKTGERLVGQVAKRAGCTNPDRTVQSIKRKWVPATRSKLTINPFRRRKFLHDSAETQERRGSLSGRNRFPGRHHGARVFSDAQRQATKDAGRIAGLDVCASSTSPQRLPWLMGSTRNMTRKSCVRLGGGTFDVSILEIGDGVFEVLATAGNNRLGGDDFAQKVMDWLVDSFKKDQGIDLRSDKMAMQRLREAAEKAKIELSGVPTSQINLPYITADASGPKHMDITLSRAKFDELTADLVEKTMGPLRSAMKDSGLTPTKSTRCCWSADPPVLLGTGGSQEIFRERAFQRHQSRRVCRDRRSHSSAPS